MNISPSEIGDLMRCPRMWSLTSDKGRHLEPFGSVAAAFGMGDLVHIGMEQQVYHMWGSAKTPFDAIRAVAQQEKARALARYQSKVGAVWTSTEESVYDDQAGVACQYLEHYLGKWGKNPWDPYTVVMPELTFRVPIPGCRTEEGFLIGTVDKLLIHEPTGRIWILDHKTFSQETRYDTEITNMQFMSYAWGISQLIGQPVEGVIYDGIRKKLPKPPRKLQDGSLSQEWSADVTFATYRQALRELVGSDEIPTKYRQILLRYHERDLSDTTPYFKRFELRYTYPVMQNIEKQLASAHDIGVAHRDRLFGDPMPVWPWSGCFTKGHFIRTLKGGKPIEKVKAGDILLGFDEATGELKPTVVTRTWQRTATDVLRIRFASGRSMQLTSEHPVYVEKSGGWVEAKDLRIGMEVHEITAREERRSPSGICVRCSEWVPTLELDHIEPKGRGGEHDTSNMQWLCMSCHHDKTSEDRSTWTHGFKSPLAIKRHREVVSTPEFAEKQRQLNLGRKMSEETRQRMRQAALDREARKREKVTNGDAIISIVWLAGNFTVYNVTCDPHSNYFVSGLLVHNCWDCQVRPICVAMQYGNDVESIVAREFVESKGWRTTIRQQNEPLEVSSIDDLLVERDRVRERMLVAESEDA